MIKLFLLLLSLFCMMDMVYAVPGNPLLPVILPVLAQIVFFWWVIILSIRQIIKHIWHDFLGIKVTKKDRLKTLSRIVAVPNFLIYNKGSDISELMVHLDDEKQYMIRSNSDKEDQSKSSKAWQYLTIWPTNKSSIPKDLSKIFKQDWVNCAIVQEYHYWESGVIFCFSKKRVLVEYSCAFEWVTAGRIRPFVAVLPSKFKKYDILYHEIVKIYSKNWSSDIEFIWVEDPRFVQVRPITKKFDPDINMCGLMTWLQELSYDSRIEDDFCKVLMEREEYDMQFVFYYKRAIIDFYIKYFDIQLDITWDYLIKIGRQYFIAEQFLRISMLGKVELLKLVSMYAWLEKQIISDLYSEHISIEKLFENMLFMSFVYLWLNNRHIFDLKESYRNVIYKKLDKGIKKSDFEFEWLLDDKFSFDYNSMTWNHVAYKHSKGIVVVEWKFDRWPYQIYRKWDDINESVILVTDQLYPEIWEKLNLIRWIICQNWAYTSHVSILAREAKIPLKIQAVDDYEKITN